MPDRYRAKTQAKLCIGDIVAVKSKMLKPFFYPKGIVTKIEYNDIGDINAVTIRKCNKEVVRRHPSDVVLLLASNEDQGANEVLHSTNVQLPVSRPQRKAKLDCIQTNRKLAEENAV